MTRRIMRAPVLFVLALLLLVATAHGQGGRFNDIVFQQPGVPAAGASILVCPSTSAGTPCSPTASLYANAALTVPTANPVTADTSGNFGFYAAPGLYQLQVTKGTASYSYFVTVASDGYSVGGKVVDPASGTATVPTYNSNGNGKIIWQTKAVVDARDYDTGNIVGSIVASITACPTIGTCTIDASGYTTSNVTFTQNLAISRANTKIIWPHVTKTMGTYQITVVAGTANVVNACDVPNGSPNDITNAFVYSGTGAAVAVGDSTADTTGFGWSNCTISITGAGSAAIALQLNRSINYFLDHPTTYGSVALGTTQKGIDLEGYTNFTGGTMIHPYVNNGHYGIYFGKWANANTIVNPKIPGVSDGVGLYYAGDVTGVLGGNTVVGGDVENVNIAAYFDYASYNFIYGLRLEGIGTYDAQFTANANQNRLELFPSGAVPKFTDAAGNNSIIYPTQTISAPGNYVFGNRQDTDNNIIFSSGTTSSRNVRLIGRDYDGTNKWSLYLKDNVNQFDIVDNVNSLTRLNLILNGSTFMNSGGPSPIVFNATANAGTAGVEFWSGGAVPIKVGSVDGTGKGTFTGISTGGTPTAGKAVCWKTSTTLGYCSTQPDAGGSCTCN